jgi:hypothetical protein
VVDDELLVADHDAFDDQPQDPLARRKRRVLQPPSDPFTERLDRLGPACGVLGLRDLRCHDVLPLVHLLLGLAESLSALLEFVELNGADLIRIDQSLLFALESLLLPPQALQLSLGIRGWWTVSLLLLPQVLHNELGLLEQVAHRLPDHRLDVRLAYAAQLAPRLRRLEGPAFGALVPPAGHAGMAAQSPSAIPTHQQALQQIRIARLAGGALAIELELACRQLEHRCGDQRFPRHRQPVAAWPRLPAWLLGLVMPGTCPFADDGWGILGPIVMMRPGVQRVGQHLVDGGRRPGRMPAARGHPAQGETSSDRIHRELLLHQPGKHLAHNRCLGFLNDKPPWVAVVAFEVGIAVRPLGSEEAPGLHLMQFAPPAALLEGRALELREQAMHLADQALLGGRAAGAMDKADRAPRPFEFFDHHVLVGVMAGEAVRCQDEDGLQLAAPRRVA